MNPDRIEGIGASGGIVVGPVVVLRAAEEAVGGELRPLQEAVDDVVAHYQRLAARAEGEGRSEEAEILEAYEMLAADPSLRRAIEETVGVGGLALDEAVQAAGKEKADELAALGDDYLAQRAEDLRAVVRDIVTAVRGGDLRADVDVAPGTVVVADELTPADTSTFDLDALGGFAIARGGMTSHTAIVARSHGLPAVVGAAGVVEAAATASQLLVDGDAGVITVDPDEATRADAARRADARRRRREAAGRLRGTKVHFDGERVLVAANIGTSAQLDAAIDARSDGIGLLRTEFLHLGEDEPPSREDQAAVYRRAVEAFDDPVIVRTLDIGGDKEVRWLPQAAEENPFLGVRGLRLCLEHPDVLRTQLAALLDVPGDTLWVMLPMVSRVDDVRRARAVWDECVAEAGRTDTAPRFGIMIETPAAALLAPHLVHEVDFVSIGTNDLTQYTAAADRGLASLAAYHDPVAPPVLRLIRWTTDAARAAFTPVGVCGGAAADPVAAVLLLGMGVRELSVPPTEVDVVRALVEGLDHKVARRLADVSVHLSDADAVRELVHDAVDGLS